MRHSKPILTPIMISNKILLPSYCMLLDTKDILNKINLIKTKEKIKNKTRVITDPLHSTKDNRLTMEEETSILQQLHQR